MKLVDIINGVECKIFGSVDIEISSLFFDSNQVVKNGLFFCLNGTKTDGTKYIEQAVKNGAVAVVCEKPLNKNIIQIVTSSTRKAMALMSANFYNNPQDKLKIIGITGTNGKTSTSYIIAHMLKNAGKKVGVIGTNGIFYAGKNYSSKLTTPDSIELFEIFKNMASSGVEYVVMEVSAHAIFFDKVYGVDFLIKILTNMQSDHLDFFGTQQHYESIKFDFFSAGKYFLVCGDYKIGKMVRDLYSNKTLTFGLENTNICTINDIKYQNCKTNFRLNFPKTKFDISTNLIGKFNVLNISCAYACMQLLGITENPNKLLQGLFELDGRMQNLNFGQDFGVIVDYAHTFDATKNAVLAIKEISEKKLIVVVGAPGERDSNKRFQIGEFLANEADFVVFTSDNPASENPKRIIWEMFQGAKNKKAKCYQIEHRKLAIKKALSLADKNSVVLVLGKGTEEYQIVGDRKIPYSDYQTIKSLLQK